MLGLDDSDRETIPDCEIYPHMMGELSDQVMPAEAFMMDDDDDDLEGEEEEAGRELDGESKGEPTSNKTDLDYYILGAFSALNVSNLPLPIQVGGRRRRLVQFDDGRKDGCASLRNR